VFTEPLPNNDRGGTHRLIGEINEVDMGSGAVMYIPSFIKIGSAIQELIPETP
jgi:hypothetical protein